jgi:geranyl-CoA carboxylase beta subunit
MRQVAQAKMARSGEVDTAQLDSIESTIVSNIEAKSRALANTARVWDDGMIDPRDTREVVAFVLSICREANRRELCPNSWGVARF